MDVRLTRFGYMPETTLGQLRVGDLTLATLEEPWILNSNGPGGARRKDGRESCVPDGDYLLVPHNGTLFKSVYRLSNPQLGVFDFEDDMPSPEWGRATILIHNGNTVDDILGCILVGMVHARLDGKPAVLRSTEALNHLRAVLGNAVHSLSIRPTAGTQ